jgi:micrococcal nuclease
VSATPSSPVGRRVLLRVAATVVGVVVVAVVVVGAVLSRRAVSGLAPGDGLVDEVVDGDTLVVRFRHGDEPVRLIGIDTPETVDPTRPPECFGAEASARLVELVPPGTEIRLERDVEARDRYGRLLAYVFRGSDGRMVNLMLVEEGFAEPLPIAPNNAHQTKFAEAADRARSEGRGLWSACARDPPG